MLVPKSRCLASVVFWPHILVVYSFDFVLFVLFGRLILCRARCAALSEVPPSLHNVAPSSSNRYVITEGKEILRTGLKPNEILSRVFVVDGLHLVLDLRT